jgi:hypothetical protein
MVPAKAFDIAQIQEAQPESLISIVIGQTQKPVGYFLILPTTDSNMPVAALTFFRDIVL